MNKLRYFIFILAGLTGLLLAVVGLVQAGVLVPPQVVDIQPPPNSDWADVSTNISITYDQDMNPATVNPQSFAVHARQTGWLTGTLSVVSGTIALDPIHPFHAGELVQVSATTATLSLGGEASLAPTVWEFIASPWKGNGHFRQVQVMASGDSRAAALGDLDGEGDLDAVTTTCFEGKTHVYHNDGKGKFTEAQSIEIDTCALDVELGDLDGDGDLDAVLTNYWGEGDIVLLNNGDGTFTDSGQAIGTSGDTYAALGDLDGDGDLDLFVAAGGFVTDTLHVWKNDGAGVFTFSSELDTAYEHLGVALGDLDGDGDLDAFTTGWNNSYNKIWLNDGTGAFTQAQAIPDANTYSVQLGDLDLDGDLDAYLANTAFDVTNLPDEIWFNDGTGHFTDTGQRLDTVFSVKPAMGDFNADYNLDVYLAGDPNAGQPDQVWLNNGAGAFPRFRTVAGDYPGGGVTLGDLDGNGSLDAFTFGTDITTTSSVVYLNTIWTEAAPVPQGEFKATTIHCPDDPNGFYLLGGWGEVSDSKFYHYDAAADEWTELADFPLDAAEPAATCYEGVIYAAANQDFYIYDRLSDTWTPGPPPPRYISGSGMGAWNGSLYVVGGAGDYMLPDGRISRYDIAAHAWLTDSIGTMPTPAWGTGQVQVGPYLYLAGGTLGWGMPYAASTYRYDMSTNTWQRGPDLPSPRQGIGMIATSSRLYVLGGLYGPNILNEVYYQELATWPADEWIEFDDPLPYAIFGPSSACTEAFAGGEIWSSAGYSDAGNANLYHPTEPCLENTFAFSLNPDSLKGTAGRGSSLTYTLTLTNTGGLPDAYTLGITSTWATNIAAIQPVWSGENVTLVITVNVPVDAQPGDTDTAIITITSQGDASRSNQVELTTEVLGQVYLPVIHK